MKKKLYLLTALLLAFGFSANAQKQSMTVHKTDGTSVTYKSSEVLRVEFVDGTGAGTGTGTGEGDNPGTGGGDTGGDTGSGISVTGSIGGHDYVDLGLPSGTLWATCNIGANNPHNWGLLFAWGETTGYSTNLNDGRLFDWESYKWCEGDNKYLLTKYNIDENEGAFVDGHRFVDNKAELDLEDDAAHVNWGGNWRMPSLEQIQELLNYTLTTTTWIKVNNVEGRLITSKINGNTLFLPEARTRMDNGYYHSDMVGNYWSRSLYTYFAFEYAQPCIGAWMLIVSSPNCSASDFAAEPINRCLGLSVRPVCSK